MQTSLMKSPSAGQQTLQAIPATAAPSAWKPLYRVGGVAALLSAVIIPLAAFVFFAWPPPAFQPTSSAVSDWFTLLQANTLRGLLDGDLLMLAGEALFVPVLLALYGALRRAGPSLAALALAFGLIGIAAYCTSNPVFSLLSLSNQYATTTDPAQRSQLVAAGQSLLAVYQGTPYDVGYVLGAVATLLIAVVMLRSTVFSKGTARVGLITGLLMIVPATAGTIGIVLSLVSLVPTMIWDILIGVRLFRLGQGNSQAESREHL